MSATGFGHNAEQGYSKLVPSNIQVGPSLPPFVEGQLRCFLHLSIGEIKWLKMKPPKLVQIGVKWWGLQSDDAMLEPKRSGGHKNNNSIKYPIRSGPKQFTAYLKDMGILNLDVFINRKLGGQVQIKDIGLLCHSRPLQGFYPVYSVPKGQDIKEIAAIFVLLEFHSVSGSFNMMSSTIPTTDMSSPHSKGAIEALGTKSLKQPRKPKSDVIQASSRKKKAKEVKISTAPPEKIEYSIQSLDDEAPKFIVGPGRGNLVEAKIDRDGSNGIVEANTKEHQSPLRNGKGFSASSFETNKDNRVLKDFDTTDLLELIERGKNLRNKMLLSSLDASIPNEAEIRKTSLKPEGNLMKDILDQIDDEKGASDNDGTEGEKSGHILERKLVDLIIGEDDQIVGKMMKRIDSDQSLSDEFSDIEDPIHENSLLTDLFYNTKGRSSDDSSLLITDDSEDEEKNLDLTSLSLNDPGNKRPRKVTSKGNRKNRRNAHSKRKHKQEDIVAVTPEGGNDSVTYLNPDSSASQEGEPISSKEENGSPTSDFLKKVEKQVPEGMDLDTITILARAHFARVIIHKLEVESDDVEIGRCTFFVEYEFPINSKESGGHYRPYSEVMRCASNKTCNQSVLFNHRSVFPVYFDGSTIAQWWNKCITFKIYSRPPSSQTPLLIGKQSLKLRRVLLDDGFACHENLAIVKEEKQEMADTKVHSSGTCFGKLQVSIELGMDKGVMKRKHQPDAVDSVSHDASKNHNLVKVPTHVPDYTKRNQPVIKTAAKAKPLQGHTTNQISSKTTRERIAGDDIVLHSLICIPEGRAICSNSKGSLSKPANAYLVCRMFWGAEATRSQVCWNTVDPQFQFTQSIPITLNEHLLERAKNNFMVIEVWNKSLSADDDVLIGIVKVSLHPFYLSFRDKGIVKTLLRSQYPVIAIDGLVLIKDLFKDVDCGHLQVLLALGTQDQVESLLKMKRRPNVKAIDDIATKRHLAEEDVPETDINNHQEMHGTKAEHIFSISIENAKNLLAVDHDSGENADCFVQYQFIDQQQLNKDSSVTWHKTASTLLVENPTVAYSKRHCITTAPDVPLQSLFLKTFNSQSSIKSLGIPFEVWKRSYYPNIRDCLLYKTFIPMAKLYAMITMNKEKDTTFQSFTLPLTPVNISLQGQQNVTHNDAVLNVCVSYQQNISQKFDFVETKSPCVCISISVLRACGLKGLLLNQSGHMKSISHSGFNVFAKIHLSFLGMESFRVSPVIARSFAPTFSFHVDFPVNVIQDYIDEIDYEESSTLAYHLENGFLEAEIFHKPSKSGFLPDRQGSLEEEISEFQIGKCKVPLQQLLSRNTGIKGWFPITSANRAHKLKKPKTDADELENMTGGLELLVKFGKETDREMVINTARGIGWSPLESVETHEDSFADADPSSVLGLRALLTIEKLWIPFAIIEQIADKSVENFKVYCRYKFYDKAALATKLVSLEGSASELLSADLKHKKQFLISASSALSWYLREEAIECQFWVKMLNDEGDSVSKRSRDKLIGSAYVDAGNIARSQSLKGSVSGLYPLYKAGSDFLGKSCVRISLQITEDGMAECRMRGYSDDESLTTDYPNEHDSENPDESFLLQSREKKQKIDGVLESPDDQLGLERRDDQEELTGVDCRILIEEALHLPYDANSENDRALPSTYVSYQLTPFHEPICTPIISHSTKPCWAFEKRGKLDPVKIPNQIVNFKLFRKTSKEDVKPNLAKDVVLGTATVDISLLKTGFRQIHGWYNIYDYSGQNIGQLKIGIIPEKPVATSPSARYFRKELLDEKIPSDIHWNTPFIRTLVFDDSEQGSTGRSHISDNQMPSCKPSSTSDSQSFSQRKLTADICSNSSLFHKLRDQMADLDILTNELRSKLKTDDERDHAVYVIAEKADLDKSSEKLLRERLNIIENEAESRQTPSETRERPSHQLGNYSESMENKNDCLVFRDAHDGTGDTKELPKSYGPHLRDTVDKEDNVGYYGDNENNDVITDDGEKPSSNCETPDVENIESCSIDEENPAHADDGRRSNFDSFDDVLNDWQTYRQDNNARDFLAGLNSDDNGNSSSINLPEEPTVTNLDDLSFLSDINAQRDTIHSNRPPNTIAKVEEGKKDSLVDLSPDETLSGDAKFDALNDELHFVSSQKPDDESVQNKSGILPRNDVVKEMTATTNGCSQGKDIFDDESVQNFDRSSDLRKEPQLTYQPSKLPNFFMPPDVLAQSMQKFRLAGSQTKQWEVTSDSENDGASQSGKKSDIKQQFERRKQFYTTKNTKLSLDKPPPLESSEMNRIASIFSSKFT